MAVKGLQQGMTVIEKLQVARLMALCAEVDGEAAVGEMILQQTVCAQCAAMAVPLAGVLEALEGFHHQHRHHLHQK